MNKVLFKQLIENKTFDEFRQVVIANIDEKIKEYDPKGKTNEQIATDIKGLLYGKKIIDETLLSIKNIGEFEVKDKQSYI